MSGGANIRAFTMPKWGIEMEEGVVREWRAKTGDSVRAGDIIAVIETDKIANDVEIEFSGVLRRSFVKEGDIYPVGRLLAVFSDPSVSESAVDAFVGSFKEADARFGAEAAAPDPANPTHVVAPAGMSISPKALELAQKLGVDLVRVTGSGPGARVTLQDVEQAAKAQGRGVASRKEEAGNPYELVKLTTMRRTIAKRMSEAAREIPHIYLRTELRVDGLVALRAEKGKGAPSFTDFFVKAAALALKEKPDVNVHVVGDEIRRFAHADIAVAVAVPGGLVTPVIRRADEKPVATISAELKDLATRARAEQLGQDDYRGGTFSLSNLGMYGVTSFDAIVNPPMGAILAIGASRRVAAEAGGFETVVGVTLSCDHRAIDGALGGEFLAAVKRAIESPDTL